jgi:hypothetical protein
MGIRLQRRVTRQYEPTFNYEANAFQKQVAKGITSTLAGKSRRIKTLSAATHKGNRNFPSADPSICMIKDSHGLTDKTQLSRT